jgi:hypothetical protein
MKPLTENQAINCETATHSRCRCRCAGKLHGANRHKAGGHLGLGEGEAAAFVHALPNDDPHHVPPGHNKRRKGYNPPPPLSWEGVAASEAYPANERGRQHKERP